MERDPGRDAAIVGMACIFPGAPDLESFWRNVVRGVDAITDVPPSRWEPLFYDPASPEPDRFYCKRGGFVGENALFDAIGFGIMPVAARSAEPDQLLSLEVAARALEDAGYRERPFPRERTSVVFGRGNYIGAGMTRLEQHVRTAQQLVECLRVLVPGLTSEQLGAVKREFQSKLNAYGPDSAIGLVPNLTASRVANRLDLRGPAYTVDAACASSLVAVDHASRDLREGRVDLAICGGVHLSHDVAFWSVFCQLGALSRAGRIRPFDRRSDGILIGEGIGVVVLERVADAERNGNRIYAVIRGTGIASDGRQATLMTPSVEGEILALERAWEGSGLDRRDIGLIEGHGTATRVGDDAELDMLARFFGPCEAEGERPVLGSVKSMIGHAMPAAGVAGLIKAAMAVHTGVLPPTLHCEEPNERLARTRFRVLGAAEPWVTGGALVAGVNAFGFGGINAHVVLSGPGTAERRKARSVTIPGGDSEELLVLAARDPEALLAALQRGDPAGSGSGPCRLALVDPTPERRALARKVVAAGHDRRGRDGLWFSPGGLVTEGGRVAFLFPGVEAVFEPRVADVARFFDLPLPDLEVEGAADLERRGYGVVAVGRLLADALREVGVEPDAIAGHSVGEWTGMIAASVFEEEALDELLLSLEPGSLDVPGVAFAAIGGSIARVAPLVADLAGVGISHDNCPHQAVLCGPEEGIDEAVRRVIDARMMARKLPFQSGFHSPQFEPYLEPHRRRFATMPLWPPAVPLWSATTCAPYPPDPEAIRRLAIAHLTQPVRFRELVETMYQAGARVFVQLGVGSLVGFVTDTLRGRPHLAMSTSVVQRSGMAQLRRLAAALFVEGVCVRLDRLGPRGEAARRAGPKLPLELGVPLVRLDTPLDVAGSAPVEATGDPVLDRFGQVMRDMAGSQAEVLDAWKRRSGKERVAAEPAAPQKLVLRRRLSVAECPELLDHCLIPQRPGWPVVSDRYPVVPMTMSVAVMTQAAEQLVRGSSGARRSWKAVEVQDVRAHRWLAVEPPVDVEVTAELEDEGRARVTIGGYAECRVLLSEHWAAPPPPSIGAGTGATSPVTAEELYADRWMFHGPAYQGIVHLGEIGETGITGRIRAGAAPGALLDNAGQLLGFWVMIRMERDRLAMPIRVERISFFGPHPEAGAEILCRVRIRHARLREVAADMELCGADGRLYCRVEGWEDYRFDTDERLWALMRQPDRRLFAVPDDDGVCIVHDPGRSRASLDYLGRRYLGEAERRELESMDPRASTEWLYGQVAARDAVRREAKDRGAGLLYPVEVRLREEPPYWVAGGPFEGELRVLLVSDGVLAAARVVPPGGGHGLSLRRVGADPGRLLPSELDLVPSGDFGEWVARMLCAKECVRRARRLESAEGLRAQRVDGECVQVDGTRVVTRRRGGSVIAWTGMETGPLEAGP